MTLRRRQFLRLAGAAAALPFAPNVVRAQGWPNKTIRLIAPFSAGSTVDVVGRLLTEPLSQQLGQTWVLENRVGAGGMTGATMVARADPDGYTILINSLTAHSAIPAIYPNVLYADARFSQRWRRSGASPNVTVVSPKKGSRPEGVGCRRHFPAGRPDLCHRRRRLGDASEDTERFRVSAGFEAVHVPFKGMPEALTEVMTGRVDFTCFSIAPAIPLIRSGKLIALAVPRPNAAPPCPRCRRRSKPATPTPVFVLAGHVPAGETPRDIVDRLHQEVQKVLQAPGMDKRLAQNGIDPMPITAGIRRADQERGRGEYRPSEGRRHQGQLGRVLIKRTNLGFRGKLIPRPGSMDLISCHAVSSVSSIDESILIQLAHDLVMDQFFDRHRSHLRMAR